MPKLRRPFEASVHQLALFEIELPPPPPPSAAEVARQRRQVAHQQKHAEIAALGGKCIACGERRVRRLRVDRGQYGRNPPRVVCCSSCPKGR